ncbi:heterokaryon incompatibility protein-domain-containing protein [Biscogniauxia mediterranea]|nr:heterokaryon incompatibility protein-domain-containing protein [Biscogniauxia mediterranea]
MEEFKGKSPHRPFGNDTDIRIMTLLPSSKFNAPIECRLEHVTLQPGVDYEAISYNWGDPKITEPIVLDGQSYPVTVNICAALRYIRLKDTPRKLWVDSICINQKDTEERSHQIPKMRDIYTLASQVLVWIGDYKPFTKRHVRQLFDFMVNLITCAKDDKEEEEIARLGLDEMWRLYEEIHEFFSSRHWFRRMWIIQEVSVRKTLCRKNLPETPILICGHLQLPMFYLDLSQALFATPGLGSQLVLPLICPTMQDLSLIWNNHREMIEYPMKCSAGRQIAWILSLASELFQATDPKDFIYSVLGLLVIDEIPLQLRPNYDKSTSQVLTESATYIIESGNLDIIQFNSMKTKDLPSWVPDWRYKSPMIINNRFPSDYGAYTKVTEGLALEVDILSFTRIEAIGPKFEMKNAADNAAYIWSEFFFDLEDAFHDTSYYSRGHSSFGHTVCQLLLAFDMRARVPGSGGWHMYAIKDAPAIFSNSWRSFRRNQEFDDTLERLFECEMWKGVGETIMNRFLFKCADQSIGIMGQCLVEPMEGDLICSIRGACGEFVLRPFNDGYKLVGICQRTVKCFNVTMADVGLDRWILNVHILDHLVPLWKKMTLQRCHIY